MLENSYRIEVSRIAKSIFLLVALSSILLVLICDFNVFFKAACFIYLLISLVPLYQQVVSGASIKLQALSLQEWVIIREDHESITATLAPDTLVTSHLLLLRFRCHNKTLSYLVLRDSMQSHRFKSLLLRLKVAA